MSIKILTKNSIDNTNIDGARQNHFSAGMRSGIVKGAFNEGRFFASASNVIALDTCELRISGHQIIIDSPEAITLSDRPTTPTKYSMIAEIQVSDTSVPSFRLFIQPASVDLRQQNLFKTNNGSGTYQLRIGNFTLGTTGLITDVIRTADIITGGGEGGIADIKFNATATQLSSSSQPTANIDYNEETKEYDAHFGIPAGSGSRVTMGGVEQPTWSADFVESERLKTLNLFNPQNYKRITSLQSINVDVEDDLVQVFSDGNYGNSRVQYLTIDLTEYVGKTLYFKCDYETSSTNDTKVNFWLANNVNDFSTQIASTNTVTGTGKFDISFEVPNDLSSGKYLLIMFYSSVNNIVKGKVRFTNIMLSTEDVEYISFKGEIINEKELQALSRISNLMFNVSSISISNSVLTTLDEYVDLFNFNPEAQYVVGVGGADSNNFKNLVGKPSGFGNYCTCYIRRFTGNSKTYECFVIDAFSSKVAYGYIRKMDSDYGAGFSGWTVIGG